MKTKNNVKFGCLTNPVIDILKEIRVIKKLGFDFVEVGIEGPEGMPEILIKKKKQIRELLEKFDSPPIAHTMWYASLGIPHESVRRAWIGECKKIIKAAHALGIRQITFHQICKGLFIYNKKSKKQVLDNFVKSCKELVRYGERQGVKVTIENGSELGKFNDINYIVSRVPDLGLLLDTGHAFIAGGMKNIEKIVRRLGKKIDHVHMHDNHGLSDDHLPVGKGKINYKKVIKLLKDIKYNKTITMEVFPNKTDARKSMNKIKRMWGMKK